MVVRRGETLTCLTLSLGRSQIRLGSLALGTSELLLRRCPFRLSARLALVGAEHVVMCFGLAAAHLCFLAFGPTAPQARKKNRGEDDEYDDDYDDDDDRSGHGCSSTARDRRLAAW